MNKKRKRFVNKLIARIVGIVLVIVSLALIAVTENHDATHCIVTIPIGIAVFLFPKLFNFDVFEFWEEFKEDFRNDFF